MQKAMAGEPGSLTVKEARIVHQVKQSAKERYAKHRRHIINATYNHSSIVQSLNRRLDAARQETARVNKELKALKAADE